MLKYNRSALLAKNTGDAFGDYLRRCNALGDVDTKFVGMEADRMIRYLKGDAETRARLRIDRTLEDHWYRSLDFGTPDYGVYDTDNYMADLWACWIIYSRHYLLSIQAPNSLRDKSILSDLGKVRRVADIGCGIGYTTAAFREMFGAQVIGTNLDGIKQTRFAKKMGLDYGFEVVPTVQAVGGKVDLVFASEYFEHFLAPIDHLCEVVETLRPRAMLIANSFGAISVGHFRMYQVGGRPTIARETSRKFNNTLRAMGYIKLDTQLWNNRPAYWKLSLSGDNREYDR